MTTIRTGLARPVTDALYALARTLTDRDTVTVSLGMTGDPAAVPAALAALATAMPDVEHDGRKGAAMTVVTAYTPGVDPATRTRAWDSLCEAVACRADWESDTTGEMFREELPPGTSIEATRRTMVDLYEKQAKRALDALTAPAAPVWVAA